MLVALTEFMLTEHFEGSSWTQGITSIQTTDGQHVNVAGEDEFELFDGTKLTRVPSKP
jgi:hypothetical protein